MLTATGADTQSNVMLPDHIPSVVLSLQAPLERLAIGVMFRLENISR